MRKQSDSKCTHAKDVCDAMWVDVDGVAVVATPICLMCDYSQLFNMLDSSDLLNVADYW